MTARNLVVIVADTLRWREALDPEGPPTVMPFLRAWAKDGVVFPRAVASSPWTIPSHASLLKGTDPWRTNQSFILRVSVVPRERGLAAACNERGGESVLFSANPLVSVKNGTAEGHRLENPGLPVRRLLAPYWQASMLLGGSLFEHFELRSRYLPHAGAVPRALVDPRLWTDPGVLRRLSWAIHRAASAQINGQVLRGSIRRYLRHRPKDRPFHLTVNLMEAHEPYLRDDHGGTPVSEGTWFPTWNLGYHSDHVRSRPAMAEGLRKAYHERARDLDDVLRSIFEELRASGALEDTWIAFVSDHGQALGEHGYFGHGRYLYDELLRVPAALWAYRGGTPVPPPPAPPTWLDHRHLFDVLMAGGGGADLAEVGELTAHSLARRGPAVSVYQGTSIQCPDFLRVREVFRSVRVFSEGGVAARTTEGLTEGSREVAELSRPGPTSSLAERLARELIQHDAIRDALDPSSARTTEVAERLKSWGYT